MATISRREKDRETRKNEIIDAAERVFCRKGVDGASMDEIAKEALFTKRTVYQYFVNKDDLVFAVALRLRQRQMAALQPALSQGRSGRDRMRQAAQAYYAFYRESANVLQVMDYAGYDRDKAEASPHHGELMRFSRFMFAEFAKAVALGQADGTIRADVDAKIGACAIAFAMTGFFGLLAERGDSFISALGLDEQTFVQTALSLFDAALAPQKENSPGDQGYPRRT